MQDKVFPDTNIFIYSIDASPEHNRKRDVARQIIKKNISNDSGVISIQVLQEFYHVATRKIEVPLSTDEALEYLHYIAILETVQPDFHMVVAVVRIHQKHSTILLGFTHPSGGQYRCMLPARFRRSPRCFLPRQPCGQKSFFS